MAPGWLLTRCPLKVMTDGTKHTDHACRTVWRSQSGATIAGSTGSPYFFPSCPPAT